MLLSCCQPPTCSIKPGIDFHVLASLLRGLSLMFLLFFLEARGRDQDMLLLLKNGCRRGFVCMISYDMDLEFSLLSFFRLRLELKFHDGDDWRLDGFGDLPAAARARGGATRRTSAFRFTKGLHYLFSIFSIQMIPH